MILMVMKGKPVKDIEPFMEDLKNIYDIEILHEEVIRENPDKFKQRSINMLIQRKVEIRRGEYVFTK